MDKNNKKTIATTAAGFAVGVAGSEGARVAKEWYDQNNQVQEDVTQADTVEHQTESSQTTPSTQSPTQPSAPAHPNYSGITEVVPVDTGGTPDVADVVIEIPQEEVIAGVDDVDPNEIAEAIIMDPEEIIDNGILMAEAHAQNPEPVDYDEPENEYFLDDEEDLAETDDDSEDESLDIDDLG